MGLVQTFSLRNGFCPTPCYSIFSIDHNELINAELYKLISTLTYVEEAYIWYITPPTSIMDLSMGNIGSSRNIAYIWQESKLRCVLTHFPRQYNMIFITRRSRDPSIINPLRDLTYVKFKKSNIIHEFSLLSKTAPVVWK